MSEEISGNNASSSFNFKNYLLKLIAYWYLFVLSIVITFVVNYINNRYSIYTYATNATIILQDELQSTQRVVGGLQLFDNRKNVENEIGVLKSYSLSETALQELNFDISYFKYENFRSDIDLYQSTPFIVLPDTNKEFVNGLTVRITFLTENRIKLEIESLNINREISFNEHFSSDQLNFKIIRNDKYSFDYKNLIGNQYYFYKNNMNSLINSYSNRLNVDLRSPNSSILWLWINGTVPQRIIDYTNKIIEVYLRKRLDEKNRIVINTIKFIDSQLANVVDSISEAEDSLQLFKQSNQILDIGKEGEMLFEEFAELQKERKLLILKRNFYQYIQKDLNDNGDLVSVISPVFMGFNDPVLVTYLNEFQKLKSEEDILKYDIKGDVPNYDILNMKLKKLKTDLKVHVNNSIQAAEYNIGGINKKLGIINSKLRNIPLVERQMQNIQRRYKLNDNIYTFLLERRTEAGITQASNSPGAKSLDIARIENVILKAPKPGQNRTKYIFIALLIPVLIIVLLDFFNNKIIDKSDIEKVTQIPIMGSISSNIFDEKVPVFESPKSPIAESFRLLKTNMQYFLANSDRAVVMISSVLSGEGKSFTSANLSALLAKGNKKTILIGLDLRKPTAHTRFNLSNEIGLSTYLINFNTLDEVVFSTYNENLFVIPSGPIPPNPAELIESPKMEELLEKLKERFEFVVLDTPPIAYVADSMLLTKYSDINLFVLRQNYSPKNVIKVIDEIYTSGKMKNMGIVINDVNQSTNYGLKRGYGFSYGYSFGYGYNDGQGYFDTKGRKKRSVFYRFGSWFYSRLKKVFS
ncbi:MAG: polysaccharide biosynthesis tyrosine autokinase [Bacteroidota bacterium]